MRSFEAMLLAANAVAFLAVAVPGLRRRPWTRWLLTVPIVAGAVQILGEGARWQLVPAYVLALALPGAWLLRRWMAGRFTRRRWIVRTTRIAVVAVGATALVTSTALPAAVPIFRFPRRPGATASAP
jgi:hypothetical protein